MSRKEHVKNTIEKFITSTHDERLAQCTFGVEIETQCDSANTDTGDFWNRVVENMDREEYMDIDEYDKDLSDAVANYIGDNYLSDLIVPKFYFSAQKQPLPGYTVKKRQRRYWRGAPWTDITEQDLISLSIAIAISRVRRIEQRIGADSYDEDLKVKLFNKYFTMFKPITDIDELNERLDYSLEESCQEDLDDSEYFLDPRDIISANPELFKGTALVCNNYHVEIVDDQSITGKELRTIGGLNHEQFKQAADSIFATIEDSEHYLDTDCSAHIHVKLGDINHCYGNGVFHAAIMEYLVLNFERLPKRVQQRLSRGNRWIKPSLHDNKYTWVNFHQQGTIEFRLFGNIDTIDDLLACQAIALEAMAYGYQVRFGDYIRKTSNDQLEHLAMAV